VCSCLWTLVLSSCFERMTSQESKNKCMGSLEAERKRASFDVQRMRVFLEGSLGRTEMKDRLRKLIESEPVFSKHDKFFLSREETYKRVLGKAVKAVEKGVEWQLNKEEMTLLLFGLGEELPLFLHFLMFIPTLISQGGKQAEKWVSQALRCEIIGCYAQTELGHGSNVRGLETTATYDIPSQQFILHSPTLTATKWWPGGLGRTATHCITHARLLIGEKDYGVHSFVVQIRDLKTHQPLKGIEVGDIGPKMGYDSQDNGFLRFDQVRIPRENMLSRHKQVLPDGTYQSPPKELNKIGYGPMVYLRAQIVQTAFIVLSRACTIATRYSCVRRQFWDEDEASSSSAPSALELPVLDYPQQQYRLLPLLAAAFAFHFTGRYMKTIYEQMIKGLSAGSTSSLSQVHATSAGLKAYTTTVTTNGIEECRRLCGGHGYSKSAGLSDMFVNYAPACTYEGDNIVMYLQTARYLVKAAMSVQKSGENMGVTYLTPSSSSSSLSCPASSPSDMTHPEVLLMCLAHRAKRMVMAVTKDVVTSTASSSLSFSQALRQHQIPLVKTAQAHCEYVLFEQFAQAVNQLKQNQKSVPDSQNQEPRPCNGGVVVLERLLALFGVMCVERNAAEFMMDGFVSPKQIGWVSNGISALLAYLRPEAVALVDAFGHSDYELNSVLGRYDGDVYRHLFEWAKRAPMNQGLTPPGYEEYLKPLLNGEVMTRAMENQQLRAKL